VGDRIYAFGGEPASSNVFEVDLSKNELIPRAPLSAARFYISLALYQRKKIIIVGGGKAPILNIIRLAKNSNSRRTKCLCFILLLFQGKVLELEFSNLLCMLTEDIMEQTCFHWKNYIWNPNRNHGSRYL